MLKLVQKHCAALAGATLLLLALCASAVEAADKTRPVTRSLGSEEAPAVRGARVLAVGVFASTMVRREHAGSVADGIRDEGRDFRLLRRGTAAVAELGEGIGIRYQIDGEPKGAKVLVDVVVRHPAMVNPDTQLPMTASSAQYERTVGSVEHALWNFDTPGSLVPGEYVVEVLHAGRTLARQAFQVKVKRRP